MRMDWEYKTKQKTLARRIYSMGFQNKGPCVEELKLLALYLRDEKQMGVSDRKAFLNAFCHKYYLGYHERADYKLIDSALKHSMKKDKVLIEFDNVVVYQKEMNMIQEMADTDDQARIMLGMLIRKKIDREVFCQKNPGCDYKSYKSLMCDTSMFRRMGRQMRISSKTDVHTDVLRGLYLRGLIDLMPRGNAMLYYFDRLEEGGEIAFRVTDYDSGGLYYDWWKGRKNIGLCRECGRPFIKRSNCQQVCSEHKPFFEAKKIRCKRCGQEFYVKSKNNKTTVCPLCAMIADSRTNSSFSLAN